MRESNHISFNFLIISVLAGLFGQLASVPLLLRSGVTPEEIAASLGLSLEQVLEVARSHEACAKRSREDSDR